MFAKAFKGTLGVGCAIVFGIIILAIIGSVLSSASRTTSTTTPPLLVNATSTIPPAASGRAWVVVKQWTGSGSKDTEDFTVGDQWRIDWDYMPGQYGGIIQIYVYDSRTKQLVNIAANTQKAGSDTSFQHTAGTFYLKMNASSDWKVAVQDMR